MNESIIYDAFISYSHDIDTSFVYRLQRRLQTLGKAWWQRRAIRVFRDETSLVATPELWSEIEGALAASRFFVICASPQAAASHWVNEEARWWLAHKGQSRFLIALSAGELQWNNAANDFIWNAETPLPPVCKGAFGKEPKWVDFRGFRKKDREAGDEVFLGLVADLAAAIRGLPKEDLLSEEVREQRRALKTACAAAAGLAFSQFWRWGLLLGNP